MKELFGVPIESIMLVTIALFMVALAAVVGLYFANRTMFRMGLRNIPRRGTQTILVIIGLMLSTLIITAAFAIGDTVNYSIEKQVYDLYGRSDLSLTFGGNVAATDFGAPPVQPYVSAEIVPTLANQFENDPNIDGFLPFLMEQVAVLNQRTNLSEPAVVLVGFDQQRFSDLGVPRLRDGGPTDLASLADDQALVSQRAADKLDVQEGDYLTFYAGPQQYVVNVAGIVNNELASGVLGFGDPSVLGGIAMPLSAVQTITGHPNQINMLHVALEGNVRSSVEHSDAVAERMMSYLSTDQAQRALGLGDLTVGVETSKQDSVKGAEETANIFTTFFLVLGLFSIAAGVMLIFMIFVMLAAERKPEMGMARAVGAQRSHLVEAFVSEGVAYSVIAGALGAALGVAAALVLVVGLMRLAGGEAFSFVTAHVSKESIIIGYTLGVIITFFTVVISSVRVSYLNIVAAIRGMDEQQDPEARYKTSWKAVVLGILLLIIPPLGLWVLLRKGLGLPNAWVWGPLGILSGILLILYGKSSELLFPFALGISLLPLSIAAIASYLRAPARLTWTIVGVLLLIYWLIPDDLHARLFGQFDSNIEMFVLSGIMIVIGSTLIIVFNARFLTALFERSGTARQRYMGALVMAAAMVVSFAAGFLLRNEVNGFDAIAYLVGAVLGMGALVSFAAARFPRVSPAMKMAVAYPLANRFRTGMTMAMFSLIIFSLTVFSILNANFEAVFNGDDAAGGMDIVATSNRTNQVADINAALRQAGAPVVDEIERSGRVTVFLDNQEVRQPGETTDWATYPVLAADDGFFGSLQPTLNARAEGYADSQAVYAALRSQPNLALIDLAVVDPNGFTVYDWQVEDVTIEDGKFPPFQVEVRDPQSGMSSQVTVIGVLSASIDSRIIGGIYTNESTYTEMFGPPVYERTYLTLVPDTDAEAAAKAIKSTLVTQGVQAQSIQQMLDEAGAQSKVFTRMFQGFMGLGLFVGIAALGVIAFRSVVERRQQIGMLRAIGYQRSTVSLVFLLESSFVAMMGIISGVIGATLLSRNLLTSEEFSGAASESTFFVPWAEVIAFVVIAFVFSMLMTWWPSRGASRVEIAEALRYE